MDANLEKLQRVLADETAGMSEQEMSWHPEGKWCAAEVLEHLFLTYTGTLKGLERAVQSGQASTTSPTLRQRFGKWVVTGLGHMPEGRKSPALALPRGLLREKVLAEFGAKIAEMDAAIAGSEARFGRNEKLLDHVVLGPLTGAEWRKFHLVHGLHHVKQIRHLRAMSKG